jgi:hypothetical protein
MRRRRILVGLISGVILFVAIGVGVAVANHTHTIGHIYHGLGDGSNNNYYVHPFSDVTDNHAVNNLFYGLGKCVSGTCTFLVQGSCDCGHVHRNWDTGTLKECHYYSSNAASGTGVHFLNIHVHHHHDWCGG